MSQLVARPLYSKLDALEKLMSSGLLSQVDSDIAHNMIRSMMEKIIIWTLVLFLTCFYIDKSFLLLEY